MSVPTPGHNLAPQVEGVREFNLRDALSVLRRRWWLVILLPLVTGAAVWAWVDSLDRTYTAEVLLRKAEADAVLAPVGSLSGGDRSVQTQFEIIRSRAVLAPVARQLGFRIAIGASDLTHAEAFSRVTIRPDAPLGAYEIRSSQEGLALVDLASGEVLDRGPAGEALHGPDFFVRVAQPEGTSYAPFSFRILHEESAIRILRNRLRLQGIPQTPLIRMSYTGQDPQFTAAVLHAVTDSYQRHSAAVAQQEAARRREFLQAQIETVADSLRSAQEMLVNYQTQSGVIAPDLEAQTRLQRLLEAEEELRTLRYEEGTLAALNQALEQGRPSDEVLRRAVVLGDLLPTAPALYQRLQELKERRAELTASRYGYTDEGSQVQVVDSLIGNLRQELGQVAQQALAGIRDRRDIAASRVEQLRADIAAVPSRSGRLLRLQQQAQAIQRRYDLLLDKFYEAQIAEAVETGDIDVLDPAVVPVIPDPLHKGRRIFLAMFLGLFAGVGGAFVLDYLDRRVREREQAEDATGAQILASVPRLKKVSKNGAEARPLLDIEHRTSSTEAFRSLRTMLRFSRTDRLGIIGLSSAEPGEGKSLVAANLAVAMAADHPRVLLIDADFPRPVQHTTFGVPREPGLSDVLLGEADLSDAVRFDAERKVHVLPAGMKVPQSAELLGGPEFRRLMKDAAREYDTVIVDTPPVLAVADAIAVATIADSMLLVVRQNVTDRFALRRAAGQIRNVGASIAGVVLNDVASTTEYSSYYDYGRNGDSPNGSSKPLNRLRNLFRLTSR